MEEAVVRSTICSCATAASWLLQIWGGKELLLRIDRAIEKNSARAEQEELAPSLAAGRSPRAPLGDDVPYNGASTVVLVSEHAPLSSPHQRTVFLSRFIQCHRRGCFFTNIHPASALKRRRTRTSQVQRTVGRRRSPSSADTLEG